MILDRLVNWKSYFGLPAWRTAMEFLAALGPGARDGEHECAGRDIYAVVFGYATTPLNQALLEAHREYADVQVMLDGQERQAWALARDLAVQAPYDPAKDIEFFHHPPQFAASCLLSPGDFAVYLPGEAHLTKGLVEVPAPARKVVVKIRAALLAP